MSASPPTPIAAAARKRMLDALGRASGESRRTTSVFAQRSRPRAWAAILGRRRARSAEVVDELPELEQADVLACLGYAAWLASERTIDLPPAA